MKYLRFLLVLLFCFPVFSEHCGLPIKIKPEPIRKRDTKEFKIPSIVRIATPCGFCSGWVVKPGVVVSAAHCFVHPDEREHIQALWVDGIKTPLKLVVSGLGVVNSSTDVAVLSGDTRGIPPIKLQLTLKHRFPCATVGYGPIGPQLAARCVGAEKDPEYNGIMIYYGSIDHGDSGGVIIDETGKAVGMINMLHAYNEHIFYSIPSSMIKHYIDLSKL